MKRLYTFLVTVLLTASLFAQSPEKMSYQAVIRNSSDVLVTDTQVGMQISILQGTIYGAAVYVETQTSTTNANGLVSLEIGDGTVLNGNFSSIDWANGPFFIKTETDPAGSTNYTVTGTSQLLSVPYALHAKTAGSVTGTTTQSNLDFLTAEEIAALTPEAGKIVFNTTETLYQIYDGSKWNSLPATCWPQPTTADAGSDQIFGDETLSTTLAANAPEANHGTGQWSILSGTGGSFDDMLNPTATFTGQACTAYELQWTITTTCGSSTDNVMVEFGPTPTTANAGSDQYISDGTLSTTLAANTPAAQQGIGQWSILSGEGGSFDDVFNPTAIFSGQAFTTYELQWTITTNCGSSTDNVIIDFDDRKTMLTGEVSKTWKLYRVGSSMGIGPGLEDPYLWWSLQNDGSRPCVYMHEFTFTSDGDYIFDDKGVFWGEHGIFDGQTTYETCFEATPANMINLDGIDVSAWLGGTHAFEYNLSAGTVTLTGEGAWIGSPKLGTDSEVTVPQNSITFKVEITEEVGFDLMKVNFIYDGLVWTFNYASYSDPSLEPHVVTEAAPWGEDLADITPTDIKVTFASRDATDLVTIDTIASGSSVVFGVDDPLDATAAKVGQFIRTAGIQYQYLQFRVAPDPKDIQFDNFTTAKIDIYVPANTDFTTLQRQFFFGFADQSQTQEWWNSPTQFVTEGDAVVLAAWTTYSFDLTEVKAREDIDMIYLGIGGGGHEAGGTFYIRNFIFE